MSGLQDFRYALRRLRKAPGFATTAVPMLALAIGISSVVFSVIYAMLIRPLPYGASDRIFFLETGSTEIQQQPASYPEYLDWRRENYSFSSRAAYNDFCSASFEGPSGPAAVPWVMGTDNFFEVFGVAPYLGQTYARAKISPATMTL